MTQLTHAAIKATKPGETTIKLSDGGGLQLHLQPGGARSWRLAYRFDGKQKTVRLGAYPDVSLAEARRLREEAKAKVRAGVDPGAASAAPDQVTFAEVAEDYLTTWERQEGGRSPQTMAKRRRHVAQLGHAVGSKGVAEIAPRDLLTFFRSIEAAGKHNTARELRALAGRIFRHAIVRGDCTLNPASDLGDAMEGYRTDGFPAITDPDGMGDLMRSIRQFPHFEVQTRVGLLLLAYTALRPGEVRGMHWSDVDWRAGQIVIPAERMKVKRNRPPHVVPMARQVREVLQEVQPLTGDDRWVLTSWRGARKPISENTLNLALRRMGFGPDKMVSHSFRKSFSTLLHEANWSSDWIEAQLAHADRNAIRATYNKARHVEDRTRMMQWWADHLDGLAETRPVIPGAS